MDNIKRLSRLTSIITILQTKHMVTASELSEKFSVSTRTIYRDIKSLEDAGVGIVVEEGKGYTLMEGYKIPPVMFTETEANALITAEKFILNNKDESFVKAYTEAINKVKSVLRYKTRDKANFLSERIFVRQNPEGDRSSNLLSEFQLCITNYCLIEIDYISEKQEETQRIIEPFALYNTQENWILIAFCRLRREFRAFRLDRVLKYQILEQNFEPHQITLKEFFENCT